MVKDFLHIARITTAFGLKGQVKIHLLTDSVDRFVDLKQCLLMDEQEQQITEIKIKQVHIHGQEVLLQFENIEDRNAALALKGKLLSVKREDAVKLPEDAWFISDLIGCKVIDETKGELGIVQDVLQTGANDVYLVSAPQKPDILVPVLKSILISVNVEQQVIKVNLPSDLYDIYRP